MFRRHAACVAVVVACATAPVSSAPADPLRPLQWSLELVNAPAAWPMSTGRGVLVAVIGTGVDLAHPDLKGAIATGGADFVSPGQPPHDDSGGGTIAAGLVAARRNAVGTVGVAPDARILPIRVSDTSTQFSPLLPFVDEFADPLLVARGIRYAADRKAKVILVASGLLVTDEVFDTAGRVTVGAIVEAVAYAWARGAVVVAPVGNYGPTGCAYRTSKAICVSAVDQRGYPAPYTRADAEPGTLVCGPGGSGQGWFGDNVRLTNEDIVAPVARGSTLSRDGDLSGYVWTSGSYVAAAHVAGVAALLSARRLSNAAIVQQLVSTTTDVAPDGPDPLCGAGLVDAGRAVKP